MEPDRSRRPPGVSGWELVSTPKTQTPTELVVDCPAGKVVLGGGVEGFVGDIRLNAPKADGTGWRGRVFFSGSTPEELAVWAICANVS